MAATVAVVGGGYGGIAVASALDGTAEVTLIDPRDAFVHNVAALRGLVDPTWTDRLFFDYTRLLARGRVVRDQAVSVDATSVTVGSGDRIAADYIVLATGSSYPYPAKYADTDSAVAKATIHGTRDALIRAESILLLGAGPVGLELAGELKAAWPDKAVTIVDPANDILSGGYTDEFRAELRGQLDALGIEVVLGSTLDAEPPIDTGETKTFTVTTRSGRDITADIWFRCYGVEPATGYLAAELAGARRADGHLQVTEHLRLPGHDRVFAVGDITAIPEAKMAKSAGEHAAVVAANIRTLIAGGNELRTYRPGPAGIALPLGPTGGATYVAGKELLGADVTSQIKGTHLRITAYEEMFAG